MKVFYNNEMKEVDRGMTLYDLLASIEDVEHKAVWLNGEHISLDGFDVQLNENDYVKVVRIRGGG
jgi:thiamine biosynthesis protein ThiS